MNKKDLLDNFGNACIVDVRDEAIEKYEMIVAGKLKSQQAIDQTNMLKQFSAEQLVVIRNMVVGSIDDTLHHFLWMLEQRDEEFNLLVAADDGRKENVTDISDGLSGEMYTADGWIAVYSNYKENF
jgi:hypothetical protein